MVKYIHVQNIQFVLLRLPLPGYDALYILLYMRSHYRRH